MSDQKSEQKSKLIRLDRLLVARGVGGRRDVQRLIKRGEVSLEGEPIRRPEHKVSADIVLSIGSETSAPLPDLLIYHKPTGQLSTLRDPWGRLGLDHVLPEAWRATFHPVGRLDADTSGLLLFSSRGDLTQRLLHPKHALPRTYRAHIAALPADLEARLSGGVETALGTFTAQVEGVESLEGDLIFDGVKACAVVTLTVAEGKHRMVRRMLHNAGASVLALHRTHYGSIALDSLEEGALREASRLEVSELWG